MALILGNSIELVREDIERSSTGIVVSRIYQGQEDAVKALIGILFGYQNWTLSNEGPLYTLTVRTPDNTPDGEGGGDSTETFSWEMPGEEVERDLLEHPRSLAVAQADIERIRAALKSPSAEYSPAVSGDARVLYLLMLRGTDHYLAPAYSVRLRRIVGCRYAKNVSDSGVLSIYSIGQLEAEAVVAQTPLPSRLCYKLEHIPVETVNAGELLNYQWGWLKKPSTETQAARQRIEINTEWLAGLWSTYIYPPFGG